jgi:hypothetical protein
VNLNRFAIPQFAAAYGYQRYHHDWRKMPHEIPDRFVRKFGEWCAEHGVKGKYSVVPFPACVGRLDIEIPGWTRKELLQSIDLVRTLMVPNWDIHPEMVSHTRVIDTKTGHPYPEIGPAYMENWKWTEGKSADEIASYMVYALKILKNIELPCEGITTPGGFGNQVLPELSQATFEACRDVYGAEIPHYFRHLYSSGDRSVAPRVEYAANLDGDNPDCVVSIIGCTGDWTGGWDAIKEPTPDRFITEDLATGRMVEVIERGEPAIIVCHWTGIHYHGEELGFQAFQEIVRRLHARFNHLLWMKNSEIARYWAAKELTAMSCMQDTIHLNAPYACPAFTVRVAARPAAKPQLVVNNQPRPFRQVTSKLALDSQCFLASEEGTVLCFDLPKGRSTLRGLQLG